jgi:hypothetical protein
MKETILSGPDAVRRHVLQSYRDPRFLFRGEHKDWTHSSLDRFQASKQIIKEHWDEFDSRRRQLVYCLNIAVNEQPLESFRSAATEHVSAKSLLDDEGPLDLNGLIYATLQHYGLPSPFIDLSENLETALFFASDPPDPTTDVALIFVIDSSHDEIANRLIRMPDTQLYRESRHARQTAHGLFLQPGSGIRAVNYTKNEDFRHLDGVIEKIRFPWPAKDREPFNLQHKKILLSATGDRLAESVYRCCQNGLDKKVVDSSGIDEVFQRVRNGLWDFLT